MSARMRALRAGAQAEWQALVRAPLAMAALTLGGIALLIALLLFARTGSRAPVALVDADHSALSSAFTAVLGECHHAFDLRRRDATAATAELREGALTGIITLPAGFGAALAQRHTAVIGLVIDNVDQDLSEDLRRSLPAAAVAFGLARRVPGITCRLDEHDRYLADTGFIDYLGISGATVGTLLLAAAAVALAGVRDREEGLWRLLRLAPAPVGGILAGRMLIAMGAAVAAAAVADLVLLVAGVHVAAVVPWLGTQLLALAIGGTLGAVLGCCCDRALIAVSVVLLAAPILLACSNTLEPQRFDGAAIGALAHLSPGYAVVALAEGAAHRLRVTPEPWPSDLLQALAWVAVGLALAYRLLVHAERRVAP